MSMLKRVMALAVAAIMASSIGAGAVPMVTKLADDDAAWTAIDTTKTVTLPTGATWSAAPTTRSGNLTNEYRSPFDNEGVAGSPDNSAFIGLEYFAVGPGNPSNPAILDFDIAQTSLKFLWGSPDSFNTLTFFLGGTQQASFNNLDINPAPSSAAGRGAVLAFVTGVTFDQIRFGSSSNAFEFSNLVTTPIPVPAAAWLLLGGLGGLGLVARRRKSEAA